MSRVLIVLALTAFVFGVADKNVRTKQLDREHLQVSCANGADPAIIGAARYNTIIVSCTDERRSHGE